VRHEAMHQDKPIDRFRIQLSLSPLLRYYRDVCPRYCRLPRYYRRPVNVQLSNHSFVSIYINNNHKRHTNKPITAVTWHYLLEVGINLERLKQSSSTRHLTILARQHGWTLVGHVHRHTAVHWCREVRCWLLAGKQSCDGCRVRRRRMLRPVYWQLERHWTWAAMYQWCGWWRGDIGCSQCIPSQPDICT